MNEDGYGYEGFYGENDENPSYIPIVEPDDFNRIGWEKMFHTLPQDQLEVLVCLYLGLKPNEIVRILHYPNKFKYYNVSWKLRKLYQERKERLLGYN